MKWLERWKTAAQKRLDHLQDKNHRTIASAFPQNQTALQLEKLVPLPPSEPADGWYGGKPVLPGGVDWPSDDGVPMTFLAALNCARFPKSLWGGAGPRDGWLLFFIVSTTENWERRQCAVLHVDGSGDPRDLELTESAAGLRQWLWTQATSSISPSAAPFPKWPVRFREFGADGDSVPEPTVSKTNRPRFAPVFPANAVMFKALLLHISERLDKQEESWRSMKQRVESDLEMAGEDEGPRRAAAERSLDLVRGALKVLPTRHEAVSEILKRFSDVAEDGPTDLASWAAFEEVCAEVTVPRFEWSVVQNGQPQITASSFEFTPALRDKPDRFEDCWAELNEVIRATSDFVSHGGRPSKIDNRIAAAERQIEHYKGLDQTDERGSDHVSQLLETLENDRAELVRAKDIVGDSYRRAWEARDAIAGPERMKLPMTEADWLAVKPGLEGLFIPKLNRTEVRPSEPAINELVLREISPLALAYEWHGPNSDALMFRYSEDPESLPAEVKDYLEDQYGEWASKSSDRVGGIPKGDFDVDYFGDNIYQSPEDRTLAVPDPPFDHDNALLLQLNSSLLPGWLFGDVDTVAFVVPSADLSAGNFTRATVIFSGL